MYSLKSLNINATKVANYDKLKADFDEVIGEKTRLEGQLHQAIQDRERYKSERNLSRGEKTELEERITELLSKVSKLEVEVASLRKLRCQRSVSWKLAYSSKLEVKLSFCQGVNLKLSISELKMHPGPSTRARNMPTWRILISTLGGRKFFTQSGVNI